MYNCYNYFFYFPNTETQNAERAKHSNEPLTTKAPVSKGFQCLLSLFPVIAVYLASRDALECVSMALNAFLSFCI